MANDYEVDERRTLAEAPGLRVRLLSLSGAQCVPWHLHSTITDTFFCRHGQVRVLTRAPEAEYVLRAGEMLAIPPNTAHYVECGDSDSCSFIIVQGVGEYDYVELDP